MTLTFDVESFRSHFESLPKLAYINSGSYGLLSTPVRSAIDTYVSSRVARGADWDGWVDGLERVRGSMAELLGVSPDEVAITASASAGLNSLVSGLDFSGKKNTILVSDFEFPTTAQIWHAQERVGARVVHVPEAPCGTLPFEHFAEAIDERTAVVAISQVCYRNGGRIGDDVIRSIADIAHRHEALVILDSYQIIGSAPVYPKDLGVDFCIGGMAKYLLGTSGIGFLYAKSELIEHIIPRATGWFAQRNPGTMDMRGYDPSLTARRFESGTPPVLNCLMADAGLRLVLQTGVASIEAQVRHVTDYALDRFAVEGIPAMQLANREGRGPLLTLPSVDDAALVKSLQGRDVVTSCRDGRLRAGFHAYNNVDDVDRLVEGLIAYKSLIALESIRDLANGSGWRA